jgi:hypothetical protein
MPSQKPLSISVGDLTAQLKTAVQTALQENKNFRDLHAEVRYVPHPGIIGFIVRDPQLGGRPVSELSKLAGDVMAKLPQLGEKSQKSMRRFRQTAQTNPSRKSNLGRILTAL